MAVIFERLEYCLLLIMLESALKILSYSAGCCTHLQDSIFLYLRTQLFSSVICSYKRSCFNIPPVATNTARSPRTLTSTWNASRFSNRKANYKTGPILQLTQFPLIYVSLNNHKRMMSCVSLYLCSCFICLCPRLVVAV